VTLSVYIVAADGVFVRFVVVEAAIVSDKNTLYPIPRKPPR
jgi:hypothetical protein